MIGDIIKSLSSILSSDESARIVLITLIVILIFFALALILMVYMYKAIIGIKQNSREEYEEEHRILEYQQKVDSTKDEIKYITELLVRLTETVNLSNKEMKEELGTIKASMSENGDGCAFGQKLEKEIDNLRNEILASIKDDVALLLESDRESIKSYITSEYHKWMNLGYIDMYSLKALDEQFDKYRKEDGNTFVEGMMHEIHTSLEVRCITKNCLTERMCKERDSLQILPSTHSVNQTNNVVEETYSDYTDEQV